MTSRTRTIASSQHVLRLFEVAPHDSTQPPTRLPDRQIEAASLDDARAQAAAMMAAERRPLRSLSALAEGGLLAYVLPPGPESAPASNVTSRRGRPQRRTR